MWLGECDPVASMETARADDPELSELREMLTVWETVAAPGAWTSARDISELSGRRLPTQMGEPTELASPALHEALLRVAGERGHVNSRMLGNWLAERRGRVADGRRFISRAGSGGVLKWGIERL